MARSRKTPETSLEIAVREIKESLDKLTTRLVGDERLKTKGLIHEVAETRSETEKQFAAILEDQKATGAVLVRLNTRMETIEQYKQRQEALNKEVAEFRDGIEKKEQQFAGGWKTVCAICSIAASCGGGVVWLVQKLS